VIGITYYTHEKGTELIAIGNFIIALPVEFHLLNFHYSFFFQLELYAARVNLMFVFGSEHQNLTWLFE